MIPEYANLNAAAKKAAYTRDRRVADLAAGLCPKCRKQPTRPGSTRCESCHLVHQERQKVLRQTARTTGICVNCISRPVAPASVQCLECQARLRDNSAALGRQKRAAKLMAAHETHAKMVARAAATRARKKLAAIAANT